MHCILFNIHQSTQVRQLTSIFSVFCFSRLYDDVSQYGMSKEGLIPRQVMYSVVQTSEDFTCIMRSLMELLPKVVLLKGPW